MLRESSPAVNGPTSRPLSSSFRYVVSSHASNSYRRRRLSTSSTAASVIGPTPKSGLEVRRGGPPAVSWRNRESRVPRSSWSAICRFSITAVYSASSQARSLLGRGALSTERKFQFLTRIRFDLFRPLRVGNAVWLSWENYPSYNGKRGSMTKRPAGKHNNDPLKTALPPVRALRQDPHAVRDRPEKVLEVAIGREVRAVRKKLGITVADLAASTGISLGMLSKIENGITSPSLTTLQALSRALGVPLSSFFRGYEEERSA